MRIAKLVRAFYEHCQRQKLSQKTLRFYESRLAKFLEQFGERKVNSLRSLEIKTFLEEYGAGYSNSTRHHNASAITVLMNFALDEELLDRPWFRRLPKPPIGRRERVPTAEEIAKLLCRAPQDFRLIYTGLAQSGARPGELCRATIGDLNWHKRRLMMAQHKTAVKTGKPRIIAIGANFENTLRVSIGARTDPHAPIFLSSRGQPWTPENLSHIHRRLRDAAGLDKAIVLYCTRHRFATELVKKKKPLKDVAELLGHSSITMTERYAHPDVTDLAADQDDVPGILI